MEVDYMTIDPTNLAMRNIVQEVKDKYTVLDNLLRSVWTSWIQFNLKLKLQLQNVKWKNKKASPGYAYEPTKMEQVANMITHGIWIVPAISATTELFNRSRSPSQFLVSCIYGSALCLLFIVSTFFHCSCYSSHCNGLRNLLHRCDRAMIYVFIASSYFPWLQLENHIQSAIFCYMQWIIWILAAIGITYQQIYHERFKCLETCFYLLMGLGPAAIVLLSGHQLHGFTELKLGGFCYIVGIYFFKSDGVIPMAHAIWHLFVVLAAGFHYYAILENFYPVNMYHLP